MTSLLDFQFGYEGETPLVKGTQCATINGFNLHAKVGVAAEARDKLLQLIKYVTRPPISQVRLSMKENGDLLYLASLCHRGR